MKKDLAAMAARLKMASMLEKPALAEAILDQLILRLVELERVVAMHQSELVRRLPL